MGLGFRARAARIALIAPVFLAIAVFAATAPGAPKAEALDGEEQSFLTLINDYRAQNGLGTLSLNDPLNEVARWMANDLAANDYFSHTDSLGRDPFVRMDQMGYAYNTWRGENLVAGTETATYALQMWQGSPGHNENMLNPHYTVIGIARTHDAASTFGWYWATEFGGEGGAPPPPPAPTEAPYVPPAPAPEPAPQPVSEPVPVQPDPPQAPTDTPSPTPTPAPTPAPAVRQEKDDGGAWWHSLDAVGENWTSKPPRGGTFLRALLGVSEAFDRAAVASFDGR